MASNRKNFFGIGLVPSSATTNATPGDVEYLSTDGKLHIRGASANDAVVMEALAQTLTNKTLTAPVIATIVNTGTLTLPTTTDTLVGRATTDTLTNKSISGTTNTLSNIANASLTNSSITINGTAIALGGSATITATATAALTLGTGLTGTSYNGSTAVTATIDTTVVATLTGTQTLTNKTLTAPTITAATLSTAGTGITLNGATSGAVTIQAGATTATYTITAPTAAPAAGTALSFNGSSYVWGTAGGWSTSTQVALSAGGTLTLGTSQQQFIVVAGSGSTTLSNTPFGNTPPTDGTAIRVVGSDNSNPVILTNNDATNGCILNGNISLGRYSMIELQYSALLQRYIEVSRNG